MCADLFYEEPLFGSRTKEPKEPVYWIAFMRLPMFRLQYGSTGYLSRIMAHELGHNLGMGHDRVGCYCSGGDCVMGARTKCGNSCDDKWVEVWFVRLWMCVWVWGSGWITLLLILWWEEEKNQPHCFLRQMLFWLCDGKEIIDQINDISCFVFQSFPLSPFLGPQSLFFFLSAEYLAAAALITLSQWCCGLATQTACSTFHSHTRPTASPTAATS